MRITLETHEVSIRFNTQFLKKRLSIQIPDVVTITLIKPITIRRRGQEMKMLIGGKLQQMPHFDPALIKLVTKAYLLRVELETGNINSIKEFTQAHSIDHADAKRMLPLGFLAPDIIEAILLGQQPLDLTTLALKNGYDLPMPWSDQRAQLGFPV